MIMDTFLIILIVWLLVCTHMVAFNFGAIRAYDKLDKELTKIKDELIGSE